MILKSIKFFFKQILFGRKLFLRQIYIYRIRIQYFLLFSRGRQVERTLHIKIWRCSPFLQSCITTILNVRLIVTISFEIGIEIRALIEMYRLGFCDVILFMLRVKLNGSYLLKWIIFIDRVKSVILDFLF